MRRAIQLAIDNVAVGQGGPFGAVVVKGDELIAAAANSVLATKDPTAHAEINAIRAACRKLGHFELSGCELYTSCEPCPMCLGAIYWARPARYYFASTREHAAQAGFGDALIYDEVNRPQGERLIPGYCLLPDEGGAPFTCWARSTNKVQY
jgi:tRNA(Arg) A34 adenosine deaminase TadA